MVIVRQSTLVQLSNANTNAVIRNVRTHNRTRPPVIRTLCPIGNIGTDVV